MENYENDDVSIEQEYPIDIYAEEEAQREIDLEAKINVAIQYPCKQRLYNGKLCGKSHPYKYGDICQSCKGSGKNVDDPEGCVECPSCDGMGSYDPHG